MNDAKRVDVVKSFQNLTKQSPGIIFVLHQRAIIDYSSQRLVLAVIHLNIEDLADTFIARCMLLLERGQTLLCSFVVHMLVSPMRKCILGVAEKEEEKA
jgi:hypothetical protein